jgi:hypothetical protein
MVDRLRGSVTTCPICGGIVAVPAGSSRPSCGDCTRRKREADARRRREQLAKTLGQRIGSRHG